MPIPGVGSGMVGLILLVFSFVCAVLAALNVGVPYLNLGWLSFALFVLVQLLGSGHLGH